MGERRLIPVLLKKSIRISGKEVNKQNVLCAGKKERTSANVQYGLDLRIIIVNCARIGSSIRKQAAGTYATDRRCDQRSNETV